MIDFAPGMRTIIRDEEWMVKKIETNSLGNKTLYCVGVSPLVKDREAIFLTDLEKIQIVDPAEVKLVADVSPFYKRALLYLESQWRQQIPTDANLHIGHKAAMDLMPYQLDPAKIALQRPRQRILIADTVGLGKTLEAGILMSELIARGKGKRILVVTVKSMMTQFQKEMWNRFTIPLVRLDSNRIQKIRANLPSNYNPFFYYDKTIVSIDTLKRDVEYRTHLENAYWDIIVIDEAQNVAERGDHQAQRSRLAKLLADRSDTMIMLSATPHDGRAKSFASLMNMLDPTAIADPQNYTPEDIKGLCIRRFKKDVKDQVSGSFLERKITLERCSASAKEEYAFDIFTEMQLEMDLGKTKGTGQLFKTSLEKSLFSSPAACIKSIEARLKKLYKKYTADDIKDIHLLENLKTALEAITPADFTRYQKLLDLLKSKEYAWNPADSGDRVVIFTERIETMKYLAERLRQDLGLKANAIQEISGGMSDAEQQRIVEDFGRTESSVRVLVASDVASEGLNLHYLSHRLIHFDIPWSLMVFQQRNGRIDRYGQQKRPDIRYMLIESDNKRIKGDMRIIEILITKEEQALKNIGDPSLLLGKFTIEDEELVVAETIESGSDSDVFEQTLDAGEDDFDPFEALMAAAGKEEDEDEKKSEIVSDETLFSDIDYLYQALTYLNQAENHPVERLKTVSGLDIRLTPDMERRLKALVPEEALPQDETLRVSDDKAFCMEQMRSSMQKNMDEAAWPTTQYLWKLHPVLSWVNDKASLLFKRDEAPVLGVPGALKAGESIYVVTGSMPNLKSTPLVDEWFLSYRGFIAEHDLYEVKRAGDSFNELDVGYFVSESELDQYTEDERVRYESGEKAGKLRMYEKGTFIYRLAGREREKSASYYTPEVLTKCLVKYALKELLEGKTADEILKLTICEPAMGSAAFLNEAINQLAEAYISRKEKETGEIISYEKRFNELQKVKMFIADRNVYGIDLNPVAVELAEVSLWLNTIYEGGFVPWFGTQLVNGNSLIGARRQVYRIENAQSTSKGLRWYEMEPDRVPLGTKRMPKKQVYHFLLGDPGMCSYSDKVIKQLEPENIKEMKDWNKKFTSPVTDDEVVTLLRLSAAIDELWEAQIQLRKEVGTKTQDALSIFGYTDDAEDSHTTIRQKDKIFSELYKSEHMKNAGPYARLKFAMDYWCALWFWPIDKADLLPTRSEFLFDMSLILEGTMASVNVNAGQLSFFGTTEMEQLSMDIIDTYGTDTIVDIPRLRQENPRLDLAAKIAEQNKFMHWELEFADLFAERGGFDLIIGNPPWIKIEWNEQSVLSDTHPIFAVKKLTATQTTHKRAEALENNVTHRLYFSEYEMMSGEQSFLGATQNYPDLQGAVNLYKCFLPLAWGKNCESGVAAFVHPEGVYDDPKGGALREKLYPRLRYHFQFANERKLFPEVHHHTQFSLNVYGGPLMVSFDTISNLYDAKSIVECYEGDSAAPIPGIKDENGDWNIKGHLDRIIHVTKKELAVFAKLFDGNDNWKQPKLPQLHAKQLLNALELFAEQPRYLGMLGDDVSTSECWNETGAQKDGTIEAKVDFPESSKTIIYSGAHIGILNPIFQTTRSNYRVNSDYDRVDLTLIPDDYLIRVKYAPSCSVDNYFQRMPKTSWGTNLTDEYRIINREMVGCASERTLTCAIACKGIAHVNTVFSVAIKNRVDMACLAGCEASLPYDFFVKVIGKSHVNYSTNMLFPLLDGSKHGRIVLRALILNCLTYHYADLWHKCFDKFFTDDNWSKSDPRLSNTRFSTLTSEWTWDTPLRTDYERRQALVEIDVLTAMALGMTLEQLKTIYRIQFPVLQSYEADTWYDANGRITFTNNRSLVGVGFDRKEFELNMKDAPAGKKFYRTIMDDTMPGGPVERTIEYIAPFDRCDREQDYETAWKFFEEKYKEK